MNILEIFQQLLKCKWTLLIIERLAAGGKRPGELRRSIEGLSAKVLYQRLTILQEHGIIRHVAVSEKPPETLYRLTPRGEEVARVIDRIRHIE